MAMKTCNRCGETKPLLEGFSARRRSMDGRQSYCKDCSKSYGASWYKDHLETVKAKAAKRHRDNPEARRTSNAKWYKANLERRKTSCAKWYRANAEKRRADIAQYHRDHPEVVRAKTARWAKAHPEAVRAKKAKRKALKLAYQGPHYTAVDVAALLADQHDLCAYCGVVFNGKYHVDHVVPLSQGGGNGPDNIALACAPCNLSKGDKSLLIWATRWQ